MGCGVDLIGSFGADPYKYFMAVSSFGLVQSRFRVVMR